MVCKNDRIVFKLIGLNKWVEANRRAFSAGMMDAIGHLVSEKELTDLDPHDYRFLVSKGITPAEWAIWKKPYQKIGDLILRF